MLFVEGSLAMLKLLPMGTTIFPLPSVCNTFTVKSGTETLKVDDSSNRKESTCNMEEFDGRTTACVPAPLIIRLPSLLSLSLMNIVPDVPRR